MTEKALETNQSLFLEHLRKHFDVNAAPTSDGGVVYLDYETQSLVAFTKDEVDDEVEELGL